MNVLSPVAVLSHRFVFCLPDGGVRTKLSLTHASSDARRVLDPEKIIEVTFTALAVLILAVLVFEDPGDEGLDLVRAVGTGGFRYLFIPLVLGVGFLLQVAVVCAAMRDRLLHSSESNHWKAPAAVGTLLVFSLLLMLWLVLLAQTKIGTWACRSPCFCLPLYW